MHFLYSVSFIPFSQTGVVLNTQEIYLRTDRTNFTTRERRAHIMKGRRYGDRICGRNLLWVLQRGGRPGHKEGREGEKERGSPGGVGRRHTELDSQRGTHKGSHKENMSPKPLTENPEGLILQGFCSQWGSKTEF